MVHRVSPYTTLFLKYIFLIVEFFNFLILKNKNGKYVLIFISQVLFLKSQTKISNIKNTWKSGYCKNVNKIVNYIFFQF